MQYDIHKQCADALRAFATDQYKIKLKAAHAHELVAAYFGYKSKNAMLADTKHPISNLGQSELIVMADDEFISQRREQLKDLPPELPDNYTLGEAIYASLFSDELWSSNYPPFRSFEKLAEFLIQNSDNYRHAFKLLHDFQYKNNHSVQGTGKGILLTVVHSYQASSGEILCAGQTLISLPRLAGHIGYGAPEISCEKWTGSEGRRHQIQKV